MRSEMCVASVRSECAQRICVANKEPAFAGVYIISQNHVSYRWWIYKRRRRVSYEKERQLGRSQRVESQ